MEDVKAARDLGWASIGIGLTELLATKGVKKMMGIDHVDGQASGVLRTMGVREILHGVDILSHEDPTPGVWARVAGDALDNVLLGVAAMKTKSPGRFALVAGAVLVIGIADIVVASKLSMKSKERRRSWL